MDYDDASSSWLAKFATVMLSAAAVVALAGAGPCVIVVVAFGLLAGCCFANSLGRNE